MDFFLKNNSFSGWVWPDWGNTAWADMGSIGLILYVIIIINVISYLFIKCIYMEPALH